MKVVLLNPPFKTYFSRQSRSPGVSFGGTLYYPYYLAYATGVLENEGFNGFLFDAIVNKWDHKETVDKIEEVYPELIVIDTSTPSIINDLDFSKKVKSRLPHVHITLVGTHPTAQPRWVLEYNGCVDSVCIGEYDYTVRDLAIAIESCEKDFGNIKGIVYKKNKEIIINESRNQIENLDELPFVSKIYKKHLKIEDYFYSSVKYPEVTILTARGCPHSCSFCNIPFKNSYRTRSVDNVIEEFEYIQNELPDVKEVMIEDDTFPINKKRTIEFCNRLMDGGIDLNWSCNARVDTDKDTLNKMKEAGCRLLCVGFETPDQTSLDKIRKGTTKNQQLDFMKNTKELGLLVNGCFMIGLPNENKDDIKKTIEFAKTLNPDTAQFIPLMVYPGTKAFEEAKEKGLLINDFNALLHKDGFHMTNIKTEKLSPAIVKEFCDRAYKEYYLRPSYMLYKLKQMTNESAERNRTIKGGFYFLKYLTT